ncbi:hypothetical protein [Dactylosporangium matsuzakiense]|uniref:Uncharacterized protein n=1 Tax=Dactylosporangium matsuzakiense TaxID=53360 RepID=A0A9W6KN52_9ACTN|nr:hypothetical protein [Dactylosporangium matsuzakiense]GLL05101.1 hypothetical protein GCM10017581_068480 [Dactylosporangium matsuzakiense]
MDLTSFAIGARHMSGQLPDVKREVLGDTAEAAALSTFRRQIADLRISLDSLRLPSGDGVEARGLPRILGDVGLALNEARECLEILGPMLEDATRPERAGKQRSRRQLQDLASERTRTYTALDNLEKSIATFLDHVRVIGIPASRMRRAEVRAIVPEQNDRRRLA